MNEIDIILCTEFFWQRGLCEGFKGVHGVSPAFVCILGDMTDIHDRLANRLRYEISRLLLAMSNEKPITLNQVGVDCPKYPCLFSEGCAIDRKKVLCMIIDDDNDLKWRRSPLHLGYFYNCAHKISDCVLLPIMRSSMDPQKILPPRLRQIQVLRYDHSIEEVAPAILAAAGVYPEEKRIFISYRTNETEHLAVQLFNELNAKNFDVFLDRFRIDPGTDFFVKIKDELSDKSMVLVLESKGINASKWTKFETKFATKHQLGVLALHLPNGAKVSTINDDNRLEIDADWLKKRNKVGELRAEHLPLVLKRIMDEHNSALFERRRRLIDDMRLALTSYNSNINVDIFGSRIEVSSAQPKPGVEKTIVQVTPRPPRLKDFHHTDTGRSPAEKAYLIGSVGSMEPSKLGSLWWLSDRSQVNLFDEGDFKPAAEEIARNYR